MSDSKRLFPGCPSVAGRAALLLAALCAAAPATAADNDPTLLVDPAARRAVRVHRGRDYGHAARREPAGKPGGKALRLTWGKSKKRLMEILFGGRPFLYAFEEGVELTVRLNADGFPGWRKFAFRCRDADGETFQWPGELPADATGWREVTVRLKPGKTNGNWGGGKAGKGRIDLPLRLQGMVLMAPKGFQPPKSILLGAVRRNAFDPADVAPQTLLYDVGVELTAPRPILVATPDDLDKVAVVATKNGKAAATFTPAATFEDLDGATVEWKGKPMTVPAGETARAAIGRALERLGWYRVTVRLIAANGESVERHTCTLPCIDPVGMRDSPGDDFQFGVGGSLQNDRCALAATMIGVDVVRDGATWIDIQPGEGTWNWDRLDDRVERAERFGLVSQNLAGYLPTWAVAPKYAEKLRKGTNWHERHTYAPRMDAWRKYMAAVGERYKGRIRQWEIWNEPDITGFYRGSTEEYIEMLRIAHEELKKADPNNRVMTGGFATVLPHGGHTMNPDLHLRVVRDAQQFFDIHTHHQHGDFEGFRLAVDGPLAAIRKHLKSPRPLYFNETAIGRQRGLDFQAETLVKKITFAKARGAMAYSWFLMRGGNPHTDLFGMFAFRTYHLRPTFCAFNEVVRALRDTELIAEPLGGPRDWMFLFRRTGAAGEYVAAAWTQDRSGPGEPVIVELPGGATARRVDMFGNAEELSAPAGRLAWTLTPRPAWLKVRGAKSPPRVAGLLVEAPGEVVAGDDGAVRVPLTLRNPLDKRASLRLTWQATGAAAVTENVAVGAAAAVEKPLSFRLADEATDDANAPTVEIAYALAGTDWAGKRTVTIRAARTIPAGAFDDRRADFTLADDAHVVNNNAYDPSRRHMAWKGPEDLSARVWVGRGEGVLRLRVDVTDDRHVQPHKPALLWKADGIQLAFQLPGREGWWEVGLGRSEQGKPMVHCWSRPLGLAFDPAGVTLATRATDRGVRYDATLALEAFGLTEAMLADGVPLSLIVNDDDGPGREGWAEVSPGIGMHKNPTRYPLLRFE